MATILALDQGTHASRAVLFTAQGDMLFSHSETVALERIDKHHIEQNPEHITRSLQTCIAAAIEAAAAQRATIQACGLAIQRSSVIAWNTQGEALSPVLSWQDTRGEAQLDKLRAHQGAIQHISGLPLSAHYGASKLAWLQQHVGDDNNLRLSPLVSYVLHHLLRTAPCVTDHVNAQRTQLFSLQQRDWSPQLCDWFGVERQRLPACAPVLHDYGKLAALPATLTALSGDQNAAIYSDGELPSDTALINIGTGAFVLQLLERYQSSDKQLTGIACSDAQQTQYVREATVNGAGGALQWLQQQHPSIRIEQKLEYWLEQHHNPPVFINSVGGLGSPWWSSDIEPHFISADSKDDDSLPHKAVAIVESIVFMLHANLTIMRQQQPVTRIRVSGGLSQLDGLCQRLASLTGLVVERGSNQEATARGIAWLAAGRPAQWASETRQRFQPNEQPGLQQRYQIFCKHLQQLLRS